MGAIVAATRDAVVTAINAQDFTPTLTAQAAYDYVTTLADLADGTGVLLVVPSTKTDVLATRGGSQMLEVEIDVTAMFKPGAAGPTPAACDPYLALAESIASYFPGLNISTGAVCLKAAHPHVFVEELMRQYNVFASVVRLTFKTSQ